MKNPLIVVALLLLSVYTLRSQYTNPYEFSGTLDGSIIGGSIITLGAGIYISKKVIPFTEQELDLFNPDHLWGVDKWSTRFYSLKTKRMSDGFLYTSPLAPFTLLAGQNTRNEFGTIGLLTLEAFLINAAITNLNKVIVRRSRPFLYNPDVPLEIKLKKGARYSSFSGHTSTVAAMYFLTAQMFNDFYPDSGFKPVVWSIAGIIPAITAYNRMRAGRHFFTDVLLGYIAGALVGIILPRVHRTMSN